MAIMEANIEVRRVLANLLFSKALVHLMGTPCNDNDASKYSLSGIESQRPAKIIGVGPLGVLPIAALFQVRPHSEYFGREPLPLERVFFGDEKIPID